MKLISDYHIHSKNSKFFHGKSTIDEIATTANELGLKEIAITDHGFKHVCGTSYEKVKQAREKIDELNQTSTVKILLGIEADIISEDGTIDVDERTLDLLDILIVGYHKMIKTNFAGYFGGQRKNNESINRCTNAYINAINKYPVTIISHLDSILTTDVYKIGRACAQKGVLIEINNRHLSWNDEKINDLIASGCSFVVSSDAHKASDIGNVDTALKFIKDHKIPTELIYNVEFLSSEKSSLSREIDDDIEFMERAKRRNNERKQKFIETQQKRRPKLSDEMESKLLDIAKENNLKYQKTEIYVDEKLPDLPLSREEALAVERAKAIIEGRKLDLEDQDGGVQAKRDAEQEETEIVVDMSSGKKLKVNKQKSTAKNEGEDENDSELSEQFGGFLSKSKKSK